jgi:hypothetical protein
VYECDSGGSIAVTIADSSAGYSQRFPLGRWSRQAQTITPAGRRAKTSAGGGGLGGAS